MKKSVGMWLVLALWSATGFAQEIFEMGIDREGGQPRLGVSWQTDPEDAYRVMIRPSLTDGDWQPHDPAFSTADGFTQDAHIPLAEEALFVKVERQDVIPPQFEFVTPRQDTVAVPLQSPLRIRIRDESPIAPDSVVFWLDGQPQTLASPHLTLDGSLLEYLPPAPMGAQGATVTVQVAAADIHGNSSTSALSTLVLEVEPVVVGHARVIGAAPGPQRLRGPRGEIGVLGQDSIALVEVHEDRLVFEYTGNHGLAVDQLLASADPNRIFYRQITALEDNPATGHIVAYTRDVRLEEFFEEGSFNAATMQWTEYVESADGMLVSTAKPLGEVSWGVSFEQDGAIAPLDFSNDYIQLAGNIGAWGIYANLDINANFQNRLLPSPHTEMDRCDIVFDGGLTVTIAPEIMFAAAGSISAEKPLFAPITKRFRGWAGAIPVWVDIVLEIQVGANIGAEATGSFHGGVHFGRNIHYHLQLRNEEWAQVGRGDTGFQLTPIPLQTTLEGSATARLYLQPKLTVYVYSLVGAYAALEPYLRYDGQYRLLPSFYYRHELAAGLDMLLGMDSRIWHKDWGDPPSWPFPVLSRQLYFDEGPINPPIISVPPRNATLALGQTAVFSVVADGTPPLSYRWSHNQRDTGRRCTFISVVASSATTGEYSVTVANAHGSATAAADLILSDQPEGYISLAGTFNDWNPDARNMAHKCGDLWEGDIHLDVPSGAEFKFTLNGDWDINWGEASQTTYSIPLAGNAERGDFSNVVLLGPLCGTYRFRFNADTREYSVTLLQAGDCNHPLPSGMVLIPGGTNAGIDPDFGAYTLTVTSFHMDKYEVTKALWDVVFNWAITNGYGFDAAGLGKAADHPIRSINWYDAVKWCNARSQMEGHPPVYTVDGQIYRSGQEDDVIQTGAAGYRLPTSDEWEYAARGGVASRRFPWSDGDDIQHARANYRSTSTYSYDTSPTREFHPTYRTGTMPYTSPVGSFAANGYGLHDMAGNVWEWCFDWHPSQVGSARTIRSGSWQAQSLSSRVGHRLGVSPVFTASTYGFRSVRSASQSSDQVDTPIFDPNGGAYTAATIVVAVSCATPEATIRYTTDGSEPHETLSPIIESGDSVVLSVPSALKAKAWKDGMMPSETAHADYEELMEGAYEFSIYRIYETAGKIGISWTCIETGEYFVERTEDLLGISFQQQEELYGGPGSLDYVDDDTSLDRAFYRVVLGNGETYSVSMNAAGYIRHNVPGNSAKLFVQPFAAFGAGPAPLTTAWFEGQLQANDEIHLWDDDDGHFHVIRREFSGWSGAIGERLDWGRRFWLVNNNSQAASIILAGEVPASPELTSVAVAPGMNVMGYAYPVDISLAYLSLNPDASERDQIQMGTPQLPSLDPDLSAVFVYNQRPQSSGWMPPAGVISAGSGFYYIRNAPYSFTWSEWKPYIWP